MSRCKRCGNKLITIRSTAKCVICGQRAGMFRSMGAESKLTTRGAAKAVQRTTGRPVIQSGKRIVPVRSSWQAAEVQAAAWMKTNGYRDAMLTRPGADGGIDVTSSRGIGQVKYHAKPVGIGEVQRLHGIASASRKTGLFFSRSGYTPAAATWARAQGMVLLLMDPIRRF